VERGKNEGGGRGGMWVGEEARREESREQVNRDGRG